MLASSLSLKGAAAPLRPRRSVAAVAAARSSSSSPSPSPSSSSSSSSSSDIKEKRTEPVSPSPSPPRSPTLEAVATPLPSSSPSSPKKTRLESFDWRSQWYPVCYLDDLRDSPGPIRVSLFDEPIALALKEKKKRESDGEDPIIILALADRCAHRGAALSEGRVTAAGCLQCPYHAWTFDAGGGCVAIPHAPGAARREAEAAEAEKGRTTTKTKRTSVRSYASAVSQGLVWLSPSSPENAPPLSRLSTLPELDLPGWVSDDFVRDFDGIDFPLLVQNVADPDHGLFAHQTPNFDAFSAAVGMPMRVSKTMERSSGDEEGGGKNGRIVGRVEAAPVLTKKTSTSSSSTSSSVAELAFEPPCHVRWARLDAVEGEKDEEREKEAEFIAAFYVTPLGLGRSRLFVRYARCLFPRVRVPRPLLAMALNGFLDQDSMVVASQALRVARAEAALAEEEEKADGKPPNLSLSRSLFAFRSPSEPFLASVAAWLDGSLPAAPGREPAALRALVQRLESTKGGYPAREEVLDRFRFHTELVPSSKRVWERAKKVEEGGRAAALVALAAAAGTAATTTSGGAGGAAAALAAAGTATTMSGGGGGAAAALAAAAILASLASLAASDVASRFEYRYTRERQAKDLDRISKLAPEVERATKEERV